jgi:hypothetical protein
MDTDFMSNCWKRFCSPKGESAGESFDPAFPPVIRAAIRQNLIFAARLPVQMWSILTADCADFTDLSTDPCNPCNPRSNFFQHGFCGCGASRAGLIRVHPWLKTVFRLHAHG